MKIWRFTSPPASEYARAGVPGSLLEGLDEAASLTIEWHSGFDRIGDFTHTLAQEIVVTERVARDLCEAFRGFSLRPVTMIQDPKLKKPRRVTKRTTPRVWLPYEGPPLVNLHVEAVVDADPQRWPIVQDKTGDYYKTEGTQEFYDGFLEVVWPRLSMRRVRRNRKKGFFFAKGVLKDIDIFRVRDLGTKRTDGTFDRSKIRPVKGPLGWVFCTDRVKNLIEERGYSHITFLEMGNTYEP